MVAEGVEDTDTWSLLRRHGCDLAQGYLISRPLPASELPAFVLAANEALGRDEPTLVQFRSLETLHPRRS